MRERERGGQRYVYRERGLYHECEVISAKSGLAFDRAENQDSSVFFIEKLFFNVVDFMKFDSLPFLPHVYFSFI